jgi:hypothetical protein
MFGKYAVCIALMTVYHLAVLESAAQASGRAGLRLRAAAEARGRYSSTIDR